MIGTILKCDDILGLFSVGEPEWGVAEVATAIGSPTSSAHELLASLADIGLLRRTETNRYRLGWRLVAMASEAVADQGFAGCGAPEVRRLARLSGHTAHLSVWNGDSALVLTSAEGRGGAVEPALARGTRLFRHDTAVARAMLADMNVEQVHEYVTRVCGGGGPPPETVLAAIGADAEVTRSRGHATDDDVSCPGRWTVAVAIPRSPAQAPSAVGVSVSSGARDSLPDLTHRVAETARRLSGIRPPGPIAET